MANTLRVLVPTVVGAATLWASAAHADIQKPAWCGSDTSSIDSSDPRGAVKDKDPRYAIQDLVGNICNPDDEAKGMYRELLAAQKKWGTTMDMTDADWADAVEWSKADQGSQMSNTVSIDYSSRALSSLDGGEQYAYFTRPGASDNGAYDADALGDKLTETGRMGYLTTCAYGGDVGGWAICQPDVLAFDYKKVSADIRTLSKRTGYERMIFRLVAFELQDKIADRIKQVNDFTAKDEAYVKLFAIPGEQHKAWASRYSSDAYLLARKMDDARMSNSRKAFDGCDDTTRAAFDTAFGKLPASTFEGLVEDPGVKSFADQAVTIALNDTDVYLASVAYVTCKMRDRDNKDYLAGLLGNVLQWHAGLRGPRTSSQYAMLASGITPDNKTEDIRYPGTHKDFFAGYTNAEGGWGRGAVGKLTKEKDGSTTITFAAQWAEQTSCTKSKETNHFLGWDTAGRPYYRTICLAEKTEKINRANDPVKVSAASMTGVKKGAIVMVDAGAVTVVYAKKGAKTPSAVFGVALK